jgi:hypothetical protein
MAKHQDQPKQPSSDEFEDFVADALKVDPKGLSEKHRRESQDPDGAGRGGDS